MKQGWILADQVVKYATQANRHMRELYFKEMDLFLVILWPGRFPPITYNKLHARRGGPFKILMKLVTNAFLIDVPTNFQFSPIFNMKDLTTYYSSVSIQKWRILQQSLEFSQQQKLLIQY